jgi:hypothetical protein
LTTGDDINLSGLNNTLNATFNTFLPFFLNPDLVTNLTIDGVQTWNLSNASTTGGSVTLVGNITSPTTLNYTGSLGDMQIGSALPGQAVTVAANSPLLQTINVSDDAFLYGYQYLAISFKGSDFGTSDAILINAAGVGNGTPGQNSMGWTDFGVIAGPTTGTTGYADWTVYSSGGVSNNIALGAESATNAASLKIFDDDATGTATYLSATFTDGSGPGNWANLTTLDASGTSGQLTVTGGELSYGLLASNTTALVTVYGGSGADVFDLTASTWASVSGVTINGNNNTNTPNTTGANFFLNSDDALGYDAASGAGTGTVVELNCTEIGTISLVASNAFAEWTNVPTLYDVAVGSGLGTVSGLINMADFPGTGIVTLANTHSGNYVDAGDISVTNAPDAFIFNFQDVQTAGDFSIAGVGGVGDTATVNYGTGYLSTDPVGDTGGSAESFITTGIDGLTVNVWGASGLTTSFNAVYLGDIVDVGNNGNNVDTGTTLTVDSNVGLGLAYDDTGHFAHLSVTTLALFGGVETTEVLPPFSSTWSETGTLNLTGTGEIWLGVTNATTITESGGGILNMEAPDDAIDYGTNAGTSSANITGDFVTADAKGSILQGTMDGLVVGPFTVAAAVGNDTLADTTSGDAFFFGDGGQDTINLGGSGATAANVIYFGEYYLNGLQENLSIEAGGAADLGFWGATHNGESISGIFSAADNGGTSADITNINGFTVGDDYLVFNVDAWNGGLAPTFGGLVNGVTLTTIADTSATGSTLFLGTPGITLGTGGGATATGHVDLILDGINDATFANAAALAAAINTTGVGNFILGAALSHGHQVDLLVAYYTGTEVNIADVEIQNTNSTGTITDTGATGVHVYASDMVSLVGVTSLSSLGTTANAAHIAFDHIF